MNRITFFLFSFFYVLSVRAQNHCISNPYHVSTEMFPGSQGELTHSDYFIFYEDNVEFDDIEYQINKTTEYPFSTKDDLLRSFSCKHDFKSSSENINGKLIRYEMDSEIPRVGYEIEFIFFNDGGTVEFYTYVRGGLYKFLNRPLFVNSEVVILEQTEVESTILEYTFGVDTSAMVYYIDTPEFEIVTEQFLAKEHYTHLEIIPAQYVEKYTMYFNEESSCLNAEYDTLYEEFLVKEGTVTYDINPAVFETVMEYRLLSNSFEGEYFYERERKDSLVVVLREGYNEKGDVELSNGCTTIDFFQCLGIELLEVPAQDTVLYNTYENCADGFKSAGRFCYSNSGMVPYRYESRSYEKLSFPASAEEIELPSEYKTIPVIRITNKEDLDTECIKIVWDSIAFQKLIIPATIDEIIVPAEYETLQYEYYQDGSAIEIIEGNPSQSFELTTLKGGSYEFKDRVEKVMFEERACYIPAIQNSLVKVGYLDESHLDNIYEVQLALAKFQLDNNLPLGVIDEEIVDLLDVKFGY